MICFEHGWGSLLNSAVRSLPEFVVYPCRVLHGVRLGEIPNCRLSLSSSLVGLLVEFQAGV